MLFVPAFWWTYTRNGADRHVTTAMWFSPHTNIGHAAWRCAVVAIVVW